MNLRGVPDDEADEVRALLEAHRIEFYETPPNRWGITMGGIWLSNEGDAAEARRLLDDYQRERQARFHAEYEEQRRRGELETVFDRFRREPVRFLVYLAVVALILYLMIVPFLNLAG